MASLLLLIAGVRFHDFLKEKHYEGINLTEIEITLRKPKPLIFTLIGQCPNKLGKLKEFLDCRQVVLDRYR